MPKISNVYYDSKRSTWYYSASLGYDVNGKRIQVVKRGFKTQREAKKAYDIFITNNSKESLQANSTMLYEEFYRVYYLPEYERTVNERTYSNRIVSMNKHFPFFFDYKLKDINAPLIQQWKNKLSKNYTNGYIRSIFGSFQKSLDLAIKLGLLTNNIAKDVGNVKKKQKPVDFWTKEEFEKVISTFELGNYFDQYAFTIIYLLFMTGLRIGEAQALEWSDIDFQIGSLNVNKSMYYQNAKNYYTHPPKTKAGIRLISLDNDTLEILKEWKKTQAKNLGAVKFVLSYNGLPTNKSTVSHIIKRHSKLATTHTIKVHALRHSHASLLISLGESALVIKDRLGHEDIDTTLGTYGHLYPNVNYQVAEKLSNLIDISFVKYERKFTSNKFVNHGGKDEKKSGDN